jgi:hypothetical protein
VRYVIAGNSQSVPASRVSALSDWFTHLSACVPVRMESGLDHASIRECTSSVSVHAVYSSESHAVDRGG